MVTEGTMDLGNLPVKAGTWVLHVDMGDDEDKRSLCHTVYWSSTGSKRFSWISIFQIPLFCWTSRNFCTMSSSWISGPWCQQWCWAKDHDTIEAYWYELIRPSWCSGAPPCTRIHWQAQQFWKVQLTWASAWISFSLLSSQSPSLKLGRESLKSFLCLLSFLETCCTFLCTSFNVPCSFLVVSTISSGLNSEIRLCETFPSFFVDPFHCTISLSGIGCCKEMVRLE